MKYIFFGTPQFASIILEKLINAGLVPAAVVTNPDRPAGRKKILTASAVKNLIFKKIEIFQPEKLDDRFIGDIKRIKAEVGVLVAYGKIVPQEVMNVFSKGIIVVHPSLLPKYRGATPIQNAILNGDEETGITLFLMDEKIDHGKIISKSRLSIFNDDTYETLSKKLADLSADLLIKVLPDYSAGKVQLQSQNDSEAAYTKKFTSEDGFVDPIDLKEALEKKRPSVAPIGAMEGKAEIIWRKVRALNPEPGVWTWACIKMGQPSFASQCEASEGRRRMKILEADLINGNLNLKKVQFEGEKPRSVA